MDAVREVWQRAVAVQPLPQQWVVLATAVIALAVVVSPGSWPVARHVVTIAHEGAHGLAALATGRRLRGIRLHSDTSGVTVSSGRPTGPGMVATLAAGYVGPALLGLAAAALLRSGHALGVLWLVLALLALLLLQIRNWFGLWSVLVTAAGVLAVSWWLPAPWQSATAYAVTWFLLLAAPRPVVELQRERRRGRGTGSDADQLARLTGVPGLAWVGGFLLATLAALAVSASWLLA